MPGPSDRALDTRLLRFRTRPGSEPALALASDLLDANRGQDALDIVGAGLAERPSDIELRILEGRAFMALGDLLKAQASLLEAAKSGQRKEPFRWLGEVLIRRGDGPRALKVLERARAIDPHDRAVALLMQQADRLARGEPSQAIPTERQRPRADPEPDDEPERTVIRTDLTERLADEARRERAGNLDDEEEEKTSVAHVPSVSRTPSVAGQRAPSAAGIPTATRSPSAAGIPAATRSPSAAGIPAATRSPSAAGLPAAPRSPSAAGIPAASRSPSAAGIPAAPRVPAVAPSSPNAGYS
ncbi:MAG: hypothetical protein J0L92_33460, partial [Deltaproteobacteria bacterium]|nr:hypothetical protein [Deltaproteobacteria bacterium]